MSRLAINAASQSESVLESLYDQTILRVLAGPTSVCPIDMSLSFLKLCHSQSCGKCVPCRVGLGQLADLMEEVLDGNANMNTIALIEKTARVIKNTSDCAIGYGAAEMVLRGVIGFKDDYEKHINEGGCIAAFSQPVPCVSLCPAGVDVPGYVSLVGEGRYDDAVQLIRKDNPFPSVCALICEHPCESACRRGMVDAPINIRGLKRFAVEHAGDVKLPEAAPSTGKEIAVIGGGPSGLTAAYFLSLMGHKVTVYDQRKHLGGMLRYGIPSYRLPRTQLDGEIQKVLSLGVEVQTGVSIGKDVTMKELKEKYDGVYVAIGAHVDKKAKIPGEDTRGVLTAVEILREMGDGNKPVFDGKKVVIIGGGNVAMDCARTATRLGAAKTTIVYRRRQADMPALPMEIEGAIAEGVELITMMAPAGVESDGEGNVSALIAQPQISGKIDASGRPSPVDADKDPVNIPADIIVVAIGQGIDSPHFGEFGIQLRRDRFVTDQHTSVLEHDNVFAGGDCVSGPATVIKAIESGKVAARAIDEFLGFHHEISSDVEIPKAALLDRPPLGRVELTEKESEERRSNFDDFEIGMSLQEALQESSRCLRCDHYGYGVLRGGRQRKW